MNRPWAAISDALSSSYHRAAGIYRELSH